MMDGENASNSETIASCMVCGMELTEEDRVMVGGKSYCKMHAKEAMEGASAASMPSDTQSSSSGATGATAKTSSTGLETNIASFLCYLVGWVSGLVFVLIEKEDQVVRFHAYQSLIFFAGVTIAQIGLNVVGGILGLAGLGLMAIVGLVSALLGLATLVLWIMGMVKAFQGEMYKFPVVGDMAEKYSKQ